MDASILGKKGGRDQRTVKAVQEVRFKLNTKDFEGLAPALALASDDRFRGETHLNLFRSLAMNISKPTQ